MVRAVSKKPTVELGPRTPERPDDDAVTVFPDAELTDDAWYQDLALEGVERESQRATGVTFERVLLERVSFRDSKLVQPRVYDATFTACDLSGCVLENALGERLEFRDGRALGVGLSGAVLDDLRVTGGNWRYALFLEARLKNTVFENVNLREASFQGANLSGVRFDRCDLSRADFRDAKIIGTDFRDSRIEGIAVHPKDLKGAIISPEQAIDLVHLLGVTVA
jgi:uncharacterized protein YjbI with pentapeptide repeats